MLFIKKRYRIYNQLFIYKHHEPREILWGTKLSFIRHKIIPGVSFAPDQNHPIVWHFSLSRAGSAYTFVRYVFYCIIWSIENCCMPGFQEQPPPVAETGGNKGLVELFVWPPRWNTKKKNQPAGICLPVFLHTNTDNYHWNIVYWMLTCLLYYNAKRPEKNTECFYKK